MSPRNISIEARERLRAQQEAEAKAVRTHSAALATLKTAVAKRADLVAIQDELVAVAQSGVALAAGHLVEVSGIDRAALILGLPKGSLRRQLASVKRRGET